MPDTALLADPVYRLHQPGEGHPERPARYHVAIRALETAGLAQEFGRIPVRRATPEETALAHSPEYLRVVNRDFSEGAAMLSTGDTNIGPASLEVALQAVGGVLNAVEAVLERQYRRAFCIVRPPGHHA